MESRCIVVVRSYECDAYGHVNNAVYLNYLELARHGYLRDNGVSIPELRALGYSLLVARVTIDYRRPATTDDKLEIRTRPVRLGRVGGVLEQRILSGAQPVAEAEVTWVCVDARGRPTRLPTLLDREGLRP
jgi:acyl-CoA thioester hydrolase